MLRLLASAAVVAVIAVAAVPILQEMVDRPAGEPSGTATTAAPRASGGSRLGDVVIPVDAQGHFRVDARIGAERFALMADTGATVIALRQSDARRAGVRPLPADFSMPVATANGTVRGARVTLPEVSVGSIRLRSVDAVVLPDAALGGNLLGMSFLGRLSRFEIADGRLVLSE